MFLQTISTASSLFLLSPRETPLTRTWLACRHTSPSKPSSTKQSIRSYKQINNFNTHKLPTTRNEYSVLLQLLDLETWWERLLQLFSFASVLKVKKIVWKTARFSKQEYPSHLDDQRVEIATAANLKLDIVGILLDLNGLCIFATGSQQELFDVVDLTRHNSIVANLKAAQIVE